MRARTAARHGIRAIWPLLLGVTPAWGAAPPMAGGKPAAAWLAAAAADAAIYATDPSGGVGPDSAEPNEPGPIERLDGIAHQQVALGDVMAARRTVTLMEGLAGRRTPDGRGQEHGLLRLASAEVAVGRVAEAQRAIDAEARANGAEFLGVPAHLAPSFARLGLVDRAVATVAGDKNVQAGTRATRYTQVAWVLFLNKRPADANRVMTIAIHDATADATADASCDVDLAARVLVRLGRHAEAVDLAGREAASAARRWSRLLLVAADAGDARAVRALGKLAVDRITAKPPTGDVPRVAVRMAEAGDVAGGRAFLASMDPRAATPFARAIHAPAVFWGCAAAELELMAGNVPASRDVIAKLDRPADAPDTPAPPARRRNRGGPVPPAAVHRGRAEIDAFNVVRLAQAFAARDAESDALAMADRLPAGSPERGLALNELLACQARVGHAAAGVAALADARLPEGAARSLARGWAQAKDTAGLATWINGLRSARVRVAAEVGVVEGMLRTHVCDPYDDPSWRTWLFGID